MGKFRLQPGWQITDAHRHHQSGQAGASEQLEYIFVIDALNGLNRREFAALPAGWEASFGNPNVRTAY